MKTIAQHFYCAASGDRRSPGTDGIQVKEDKRSTTYHVPYNVVYPHTVTSEAFFLPSSVPVSQMFLVVSSTTLLPGLCLCDWLSLPYLHSGSIAKMHLVIISNGICESGFLIPGTEPGSSGSAFAFL